MTATSMTAGTTTTAGEPGTTSGEPGTTRNETGGRRPSEPHGPLGLGGLRLTQRGRAVLVALAVLVSAGFGLLGTQAMASAPGEPLEVRVHTVEPGETLWQYAAVLAEAGQDVRDVVDHLRELNGLRTAELEVGQVVLLPAE